MSESYGYNASTGNLSSKTGMGTYGYNDSSHKHAVTHLNNVPKYTYDANGNMITRIANGLTYNLSYNAENHLVGVSGAATATFTYRCNGKSRILEPEKERRTSLHNTAWLVLDGGEVYYTQTRLKARILAL